MGACCSKTGSTITTTPTPPEVKVKPNPEHLEKNTVAASPTQPGALTKDVFVVKHRKSHEVDTHPDQETRKSTDRKKTLNSNPHVDISQPETIHASGCVLTGESGKLVGMAATVRTSSCTKEEVEEILIQCGRLSRSSSGVKPDTPPRGRRYSGSKRSFDFDTEIKNEDEEGVGELGPRESARGPKVSTPSRRRSRERDPLQQRSGSKERGSGERRRVSRSPNRRSESPNPSSNGIVLAGCGNNHNRPGKMVSVPATDKSSNAGGGDVVPSVGGGVKKIQVKQQPMTLSRSNSKKAEHSPYRRNPLGEIDTNVVGSEQPGSKKTIGENQKVNQIVSRTRSLRLSRDLDINPETLTNPTPNPPSYASLLLEDIQNFHQKNPPAAAADPQHQIDAQLKVVNDDPSLHKYVTVRRGGGDADTEEKESSGSNSFAGSQQLSWISSSWEPNSGDSTDSWTSKLRSHVEGDRSEHPRNGIGRGRVGVPGRSAST